MLSHYKGKPLPEGEYFANYLVKEFNIPRDRVSEFIRVFSENQAYLKSFGVQNVEVKASPSSENVAKGQDDAEKTRQFLDTCFVLMPFGEWFDKYYEELYKPAIREAGFEPVRADSLFNTGSVMEQIWDQISNAKILLVELTGKNPNVFYELGLSHASRKPVVFVTSDMNDVPFDLRHLRIVKYDIRMPDWGKRLREELVQYINNAKIDPYKSIPQPFRDILKEEMGLVRGKGDKG
ncbi:MAG: hypothetical protein AB7F86_04080 [Bdellovibrionales bacterium]